MNVFIWEMAGIPFLIIAGSILHFTFEWTNKRTLVGLFSPVNESVWEHLKLGFWSLMLFSLAEYVFIGNDIYHFMFAKAIGILVLQLCILITFYTYTKFTRKPILWIDISSYIVGSVLCQIISYTLLTKIGHSSFTDWAGIRVIILHALVLIVFTFFPPRLPIFKDYHTFTYGIWKKP